VFFYQPFNIPSGSMKSTLLVGDYLFVSKLSYGYSRYSFPLGLNYFSGRVFASEPRRGDVAVFKTPLDNSTDYIKRIIGLPGDEIAVRGGVVWLNGKEIPRRKLPDFISIDRTGVTQRIQRFEEELPGGVKYTVLDLYPNGTGSADNKGPYRVPAGHYFMMGDNRDDSLDSRISAAAGGVGYVPFENFVGRADVIFLSLASDEPLEPLISHSSVASKTLALVQVAALGRVDLIPYVLSKDGPPTAESQKPWSWLTFIRWQRIFTPIR
jgi:signal peptidase I